MPGISKSRWIYQDVEAEDATVKIEKINHKPKTGCGIPKKLGKSYASRFIARRGWSRVFTAFFFEHSSQSESWAVAWEILDIV